MFYAVILMHSKEIKVVPEHWVKINKFDEKYNEFGVRAGAKKFIIFTSPNEGDEPMFGNAAISTIYDGNNAGYYMANVLYIFGKNQFN